MRWMSAITLAVLVACSSGEGSDGPAAASAPTEATTPTSSPDELATPETTAPRNLDDVLATQADLEGTRWRVTDIGGVALSAPARFELVLRSDRLAGRDGCNQWSTETNDDGRWFPLRGSVRSTDMGCPDIPGRRDYWDALRSATDLRRNGDTLELHDPAGVALLTLEPA